MSERIKRADQSGVPEEVGRTEDQIPYRDLASGVAGAAPVEVDPNKPVVDPRVAAQFANPYSAGMVQEGSIDQSFPQSGYEVSIPKASTDSLESEQKKTLHWKQHEEAQKIIDKDVESDIKRSYEDKTAKIESIVKRAKERVGSEVLNAFGEVDYKHTDPVADSEDAAKTVCEISDKWPKGDGKYPKASVIDVMRQNASMPEPPAADGNLKYKPDLDPRDKEKAGYEKTDKETKTEYKSEPNEIRPVTHTRKSPFSKASEMYFGLVKEAEEVEETLEKEVEEIEKRLKVVENKVGIKPKSEEEKEESEEDKMKNIGVPKPMAPSKPAPNKMLMGPGNKNPMPSPMEMHKNKNIEMKNSLRNSIVQLGEKLGLLRKAEKGISDPNFQPWSEKAGKKYPIEKDPRDQEQSRFTSDAKKSESDFKKDQNDDRYLKSVNWSDETARRYAAISEKKQMDQLQKTLKTLESAEKAIANDVENVYKEIAKLDKASTMKKAEVLVNLMRFAEEKIDEATKEIEKELPTSQSSLKKTSTNDFQQAFLLDILDALGGKGSWSEIEKMGKNMFDAMSEEDQARLSTLWAPYRGRPEMENPRGPFFDKRFHADRLQGWMEALENQGLVEISRSPEGQYGREYRLVDNKTIPATETIQTTQSKLKAVFTKLPSKLASYWSVYSNDKPILRFRAKDAFGLEIFKQATLADGKADPEFKTNWDYISSKEYGKLLLSSVKQNGIVRTASEIGLETSNKPAVEKTAAMDKGELRKYYNKIYPKEFVDKLLKDYASKKAEVTGLMRRVAELEQEKVLRAKAAKALRVAEKMVAKRLIKADQIDSQIDNLMGMDDEAFDSWDKTVDTVNVSGTQPIVDTKVPVERKSSIKSGSNKPIIITASENLSLKDKLQSIWKMPPVIKKQ